MALGERRSLSGRDPPSVFIQSMTLGRGCYLSINVRNARAIGTGGGGRCGRSYRLPRLMAMLDGVSASISSTSLVQMASLFMAMIHCHLLADFHQK
jgi:hypothetical protein